MTANDPTRPLALVVDDDSTFCTLTRLTLEQSDFLGQEAASGQAAI